MFRLRILGTVELTGPDGSEVRAVLAQPKRFALLTYLALSTPGGFCRRDTLLALFWPEKDDSRGRDALKQAVRFLRVALDENGHSLIRGRGVDEIGIAPGALWCDAIAFEKMAAAGHHEEALSLYRGNLLDGFFAGASTEFHEWLESERGRRRAAASIAARMVAEQRLRAHDDRGAVALLRRSLELAGPDERVLRELLSLLDQLGDRAGAVQAYDEFARRLSREYEVEPSAESRALMEHIRTRADAPQREPALVAIPAPPGAVREVPRQAPAAGVAERPTAPQPSRRERSGRLLRLSAIVSVLVITVATVMSRIDGSAVRGTPPSTDAFPIAILPFAVHGGGEELAFLGEGMVDLLSINLDGAGDVRSVNPRALLGHVHRLGGATAVRDPEGAGAVARHFGARAFVLGTIAWLGPRVRIAAWLYPLDALDADTIQAVVEGAVQDAAVLVDSLTTQLLVGRLRGESAYFARLGASTTNSLAALKAYLEGEARWRAREADAAVSAFRLATERDTTFALAWYRLAVATEWSIESNADEAIERALRHASRLPERYQRLLRAFHARRGGDAGQAAKLYRDVLRAHPDDPEAWFQLGTLQTPQSLPWGVPTENARAAFERVLSLDPAHPRAPGALSWLDGHEGRHADAVARLKQLQTVDRGELGLVIRTALAFAGGTPAAQKDVIEELRDVPDPQRILFTPDFVAQRVGDLEGAIRVARVLTEPSRAARWRAFGHARIGDLELARGRYADGWAMFALSEQHLPEYGRLARAYVALSPFLSLSRADLLDVRSDIADWSPRSMSDSLRRAYLLGQLSSRLHDSTALRRYVDWLEEFAAAEREGSMQEKAMATDLALAVRADRAWRSERHSEALALLERWRPERWWVPRPTVTKPDPHDLQSLLTGHYYSADRWTRAVLLEKAGREREALDWYDGLGFLSGEDMAYLAPSRLRMGELYERLGERELALAEYARVAKLWSNSGPELRPQVEDVRRRIARLRGLMTRR